MFSFSSLNIFIIVILKFFSINSTVSVNFEYVLMDYILVLKYISLFLYLYSNFFIGAGNCDYHNIECLDFLVFLSRVFCSSRQLIYLKISLIFSRLVFKSH